MIDLVILAGGFGSRMKSVSKGIPKALLPLDKGVFLDKILNKIINFKVKDIYLSLYYKPELFEKYLIDLPINNKSGLIDAANILKKVDGISFVYFDETDVVRHKLVKNIIKAYARNDSKKKNGK